MKQLKFRKNQDIKNKLNNIINNNNVAKKIVGKIEEKKFNQKLYYDN